MKKYFLLGLFGFILLSSCGSNKILKSQAYQGFYKEKPVAILIMPPINRVADVDAKELFHATLCMPLCNAGYYVIPPFLSMEILKRESAYDSELFLDAPLTKFKDVFGADLALFTIIHKWDKTKIIGKISVEVEYIFKSLKSEEIVYQRTGNIIVNPISFSYSINPLNLIIDAAMTVTQTVQNATSDNSLVGFACNNETLYDLPAGPYSPLNGKDGNHRAREKEFKKNLSGNAKSVRNQTKAYYSYFTKKK